MWGGRFATAPSDLLRALNDSFPIDRELIQEDLDGSIAWVGALREAEIVSSEEQMTIVGALREIARECSETDLLANAVAGRLHEDVHSFVESELVARIGDLGRRLHTGRSRNDQVATDLRLWLKGAFSGVRIHTLQLACALAVKAKSEAGTPMPGYTHLKQAEPVTFGHWCLAWVEMLLRDADRFQRALERADECPLGAGALAGTPLSIDREALAHELGFARATANSIDAVASRDSVIDWHHAAASLLVNLSRLAEDLIVLSSDEFSYVALPDNMATGSSRMPQKKNPDLLELVRALAGRAIGDLASILSVIKGIPLAYDKDLQLDKEALFRQRATLDVVLPALGELVSTLTIDRPRMRNAAGSDLLLATAVADRMAARGVAFRAAHEQVGALVAEAERRQVRLRAMEPVGDITADDLEALDLDRAVEMKDVIGGTAPARVAEAARAALEKIEELTR